MIRIMTSNIWGDYFNKPVESRKENVITYIKTYFPDVVGLQEITPGWYNSGLFKHLSTFYETVEFGLNNYQALLNLNFFHFLLSFFIFKKYIDYFVSLVVY